MKKKNKPLVYPSTSYIAAVFFLGLVALIGLLGVVLVENPSDGLIAITSSAVGGLVGLFTGTQGRG